MRTKSNDLENAVFPSVAGCPYTVHLLLLMFPPPILHPVNIQQLTYICFVLLRLEPPSFGPPILSILVFPARFVIKSWSSDRWLDVFPPALFRMLHIYTFFWYPGCFVTQTVWISFCHPLHVFEIWVEGVRGGGVLRRYLCTFWTDRRFQSNIISNESS